jgi:small subunit ribosomal protein S16
MKRMGRKNRPFFRLYACDSRAPRDGSTIELLGHYDPMSPKVEEQLKLNPERIKYWVSVGAQPSETVWSLIARQGIEIPARKKRVRRKSKAKAKKWTPPKKKVPRPKAKKKPAEGEAKKE